MTGSGSAIATMRRVAAIATLASRLETFRQVLPAIHAQVDHVFIYLDGYSAPPSFLANFDRITVRSAKEVGDLHASSRFLCLKDLSIPTVVAMVDDDIVYPPDYVDRLVGALQRFGGEAIVGVHGRIFLPPHQSFVRDATVLHFTHELVEDRQVHIVGSGTCAFISSNFNVDPRKWDAANADDIFVAIEAQRRGLPRIAVARVAGWLKAIAESQPDSIWAQTVIDDSEKSRHMRALLRLY